MFFLLPIDVCPMLAIAYLVYSLLLCSCFFKSIDVLVKQKCPTNIICSMATTGTCKVTVNCPMLNQLKVSRLSLWASDINYR